MPAEASNTTEITPALLRAWRACYPDDRILKLWAGRPSLTPRQVSELPGVPAHDVVWVLVRCLAPARAAAFARWCADRAVVAAGAHPVGEVVNHAIDYAARAADCTHDDRAVYYATRAADCATYAAARYTGDYAASWATERRTQVDELLRVLESA